MCLWETMMVGVAVTELWVFGRLLSCTGLLTPTVHWSALTHSVVDGWAGLLTHSALDGWVLNGGREGASCSPTVQCTT